MTLKHHGLCFCLGSRFCIHSSQFLSISSTNYYLRERVKVYPENLKASLNQKKLKTKLRTRVQTNANSIEYFAIKYVLHKSVKKFNIRSFSSPLFLCHAGLTLFHSTNIPAIILAILVSFAQKSNEVDRRVFEPKRVQTAIIEIVESVAGSLVVDQFSSITLKPSSGVTFGPSSVASSFSADLFFSSDHEVCNITRF